MEAGHAEQRKARPRKSLERKKAHPEIGGLSCVRGNYAVCSIVKLLMSIAGGATIVPENDPVAVVLSALV